ncbi:MFS transporter [Pseudoduganella sp. FT26W]|uniref:MFS transporter n=1 Tax=Duganella aquatilis TaxID=2666082 RepID=A0A844D9K2_9BURK|nr:MFS transporter [Duganella aquatilis]MRW85432.1 MFS transporter [Duganella aquatilis]
MDSPRHPREKTLLATVFLLNGVEFLQAGMMAFGAAPIMGQIGASPEEFTVVTILYAVVAIAAIAQMGWLIERLGWRRYVQASVAVFVVGTAICAGSSSLGQFLLGRLVMALGGAPFMTSARLMITHMPPTPRRFLGIKVFASALAIGNALAPWLAGEAVTADRWSVIFIVPGLLAGCAAILAIWCLPNQPAPAAQRSAQHLPAMAALVAGCFLVLYAFQRATYDFFDDPAPLAVCAGAGVALLWLVVRQLAAQRLPLLALSRLWQPRYLAGLALFTVCYMVLGANNYMLPVLTQRALGNSWQVAGTVQAGGLLSALAAFWVMAAILPAYPAPKKFYTAGFVFLAACGVLLFRLNGDADLWRDVFPAVAGYGAFIILVMATTALQAFAGLQQDAQGFNHGQQLKNMMSQFGVAAGVAVAALSLQWRNGEHYTALVARFGNGDAAFNEAVARLAQTQPAQVAVGQLAQQLNQQAILLASLDYFGFLVVFSLLGIGVMTLQRVLK